MDDLLPSYESVIRQNPWELVAPYLPSEDLCSAALVCQSWHQVFTPHLWGDPASHFGVENDTVYVALTRFKRTLFWARPCVRELTYTLHLPPAHAELYGGPHSEWLRDCLERLPRLQSLIVDGLPFFDHSSLLTLRHSSQWSRSTHPNSLSVFGLRLLDASRCTNATSTGLSEALSHFPDLVSLDLSRTLAAKDEAVFARLKMLRNLRVLKLAGLGLKDTDLTLIATAIGTRVRSLDVRENILTDSSARLLLEHCIKETFYTSYSTRAPLPPVEDGRPLGETDLFGTENLDRHLRKKLTQGFIGSLAIEDARDVGITHLYLSKNVMTVEGISGLLRSKRLQVLDVGTLPLVLQKPAQLSSEEDGPLLLPGVEKLTPVIAEYASDKLRYLRINYSIVTEDAPVDALPSHRAELQGDAAVYISPNASELQVLDTPTPELDSTITAVYELPAETVQPVELPSSSTSTGLQQRSNQITPPLSPNPLDISSPPIIKVISEPQEIKRGPAYAPEPVLSDPLFSPISPTVDATGGLSPESTSFPIEGGNFDVNGGEGRVPRRTRHNSMYYVEDQRARLDLRQSQEPRLHPGMLPNVHTLVLTDVPSITENQEVVRCLIQFIKDCAEEVSIARLRAAHTYMLPPGRTRNVAEGEYARSLFALRRIILEMAPPEETSKKISASWRQSPTKSSTEDADSEAFWEAATHDFSFFDDEECGLPNANPGRHFPPVGMDGLMLAEERPAPAPMAAQKTNISRPIDVVSEIGRFRKERKAAYRAALQREETEPTLEGYWPGDITVVRKPASPQEGDLDYYGNRFESGWLYR